MDFIEIYGMLYDAFGEYGAAKQSKDKAWIKTSRKTLINTITSVIASCFTYIFLMILTTWFPLMYAFPGNIKAQLVLFILILCTNFLSLAIQFGMYIKGFILLINGTSFSILDLIWCVYFAVFVIFTITRIISLKK